MLLTIVIVLTKHRVGSKFLNENVDNDEFGWTLARTSVELCGYAYCDISVENPEYLFTDTCRGFEFIGLIKPMGGFVGYMAKQNAIYVVYKGTSSQSDRAIDADILLTPYAKCKDCEVHQGFYAASQLGIWSVVYFIEKIKLLHPFAKVVVTGHSMGGAVALLAALELLDYGVLHMNLINFGSPRVGNHAFASYASHRLRNAADSHYRVTHGKDCVPNMPSIHAGYLHIDGEWYEEPTLVLNKCTGYEDKRCAAQWEDMPATINLPIGARKGFH